MATLVNKHNREVEVIIPNIREFRTFYSDNEGMIGMFFKRDWVEETTKKEEHWQPSEEHMKALFEAVDEFNGYPEYNALKSLYDNLQKLI